MSLQITIEAHVLPYPTTVKEKDILQDELKPQWSDEYAEPGALENWSRNTKTRLNEIKTTGILNINRYRKHINSEHGLNQAVKKTVLAVKEAVGALTEVQMTGCVIEIPKLFYKTLPPLEPIIIKTPTATVDKSRSLVHFFHRSSPKVDPPIPTFTKKVEKPPFENDCQPSFDLHKHELDVEIDFLKRSFHETAEHFKAIHFNNNIDADTIINKAQDDASAAMIAARTQYCALLPVHMLFLLEDKL